VVNIHYLLYLHFSGCLGRHRGIWSA